MFRHELMSTAAVVTTVTAACAAESCQEKERTDVGFGNCLNDGKQKDVIPGLERQVQYKDPETFRGFLSFPHTTPL